MDSSDPDAPVKILKEMVIGTNDDVEATHQLSYCGVWDVPDATVTSYLNELDVMALNDGQAIQAYELDTIATVRGMLDRLSFWAIEEAHDHVRESPLSRHNPCLLSVLLHLLAHKRPKITSAVFRVLKDLMFHVSRRGTFTGEVISYIASGLLAFPNVEDLVEEGTAALVTLAKNDPEAVLLGDGVSATLHAMQTLSNHTGVQRNGCLLFAALVDGVRSDVQDPPAALLLVHVGVAVDFMCRAYRRQPQDTLLSAAVAHTLSAMARYEQNRSPLVEHTMVLSTLRHLSEHHPFAPRTVMDAMSALSDVVDELDVLQKRSIALSLKGLMTNTTETETLSSSIALILKLLRSEDGGESGGSTGEDGSHGSSSQPLHAMREFLSAQQVPQVIAIALDHFGEDDVVLRNVASMALREMVISKFFR